MARPLLRHGGSKDAAGAEVEVRDRRKKVFFQKMETAFQKNLAERDLLPDSFQKRPPAGRHGLHAGHRIPPCKF